MSRHRSPSSSDGAAERSRILGFACELVAGHGPLLDATVEWWAGLSVAEIDQLLAATRDARTRLLDSSLAEQLTHHEGDARDLPVLAAAQLLALLDRCANGHRCRHISESARPLIAFGAARVLTCRDCSSRFKGALAASDHRILAGVDRMCDLCVSEPENHQYRKIVLQIGPVTIIAEACDACGTMLDGALVS
jgi:hypothetical protein